MEDLQRLVDVLEETELHAHIEECARTHELHLERPDVPGVLRSPLGTPAGLLWSGVALRSLWLLSQRGFLRAGFRKHPDSQAILLAWRGQGLVLSRPAGERLSFQLVPWTMSQDSSTHFVEVPAQTPYDTLADVGFWHLVVFHTQSAERLVRLQETQDGWVEQLENEQRSGATDG